ncbi:UDP-23-diacylglucosamine hydrolase [Perkinsela sp. CCAP 1560/4]|nr:UDP-23-diacylglucosamine hydrolase [Perkinsela sp. CCAP 1560/4]|eukprot:KNH09776.1 UDP-23-diacylglucosamine hydrolase [Perkinsela sp. CCAP 1560/4]
MKPQSLLRGIAVDKANGNFKEDINSSRRHAMLLTDVMVGLKGELQASVKKLSELRICALRKSSLPMPSPNIRRLISLGKQEKSAIFGLARISIIGKVVHICDGVGQLTKDHSSKINVDQNAMEVTRISVSTYLNPSGTYNNNESNQKLQHAEFTLFCIDCFSKYASENMQEGDVFYAVGDLFHFTHGDNSPSLSNILVGHPVGSIVKLGRFS